LKNGEVGVGLGTQIVRALIEGELRGTIRWFSPRDGGTKVSISLPVG
jgi:two-component sensor histidine kinase